MAEPGPHRAWLAHQSVDRATGGRIDPSAYFKVRYHPVHVRRLLRSLGLSRQKPQLYARERDEATITHWRRYRWPALKKRHAGSAAGRCF
jgi:transposase